MSKVFEVVREANFRYKKVKRGDKNENEKRRETKTKECVRGPKTQQEQNENERE